jgi:hypothetical protein
VIEKPQEEGRIEDGTKLCRPRGTQVQFLPNPALRPALRDYVLGCHDTPSGLGSLAIRSIGANSEPSFVTASQEFAEALTDGHDSFVVSLAQQVAHPEEHRREEQV